MIELTYDQLLQKYEEAQEIIAEQQMEIQELKEDLDNYCRSYEELLDKIASTDINIFG